MIRNDSEELSRSEITKQGLGNHMKEFELFPPTTNPYNSAQRVKLKCVPGIMGLKPFFPINAVRNPVRNWRTVLIFHFRLNRLLPASLRT